MAAYSAVLRGASDVYVVDRVAERLNKAKDIGCIPIDFSKADAVDQILKLRGGSVASCPIHELVLYLLATISQQEGN